MWQRLWSPRTLSLAACGAAGGLLPQRRKPALRAEVREPVFTRQQVSEHSDMNTGVWVTHRGGVYDVTHFIHKHPGGAARILQGAGGDVQAFFDHWAVHKQPLAQSVLAKFRIGWLTDADLPSNQDSADDDPYKDEPVRSPALRGLSGLSGYRPYIAEPRVLPHSFETPAELFYVRNHAPVPQADCLGEHTIGIYWEDDLLAEWSITDLAAQFQQLELHATLQCSGNRLGEMAANLEPGSKAHASWRGRTDVAGYQIGTARWAGTPLASVVRAAIQSHDQRSASAAADAQFVELHGDDGYFVSLPLSIVLAEDSDAVLATHMNGSLLPPDHGAPVRLLLPGVVGCRSVKWLSSIVLRKDEGDSPWTRTYYRNGDEQIMYWPVQSMITAVQGQPAAELSMGKVCREVAIGPEGIQLEGFAYAGGGHQIDRVEVSADGGALWQEAQIQQRVVRPSGKQWAWTLWAAELQLPKDINDGGEVVLCCRAWDCHGKTQPATADEALANTPSGYLFNSVYKIRTTVYLKGNPDHILSGVNLLKADS